MSSTSITSDSNNPISASLKRLIWKERRELMPVWVGIILIAVFGLAMLAFQASIPMGKKDIVATCLYSFIAILSATLAIVGFANESESGTLGRLQNLPIHPRSIGVAKLVLGALATLAGAMLLVLLTHVLCGIFGFALSDSAQPFPLILMLAGSLLVYFAAAVVSMLTRSMGQSMFFIVVAIVPMLYWLGTRNWQYVGDDFGIVLTVEVALVVLTAVISINCLVPWVEGRGLKIPGSSNSDFVMHKTPDVLVSSSHVTQFDSKFRGASFWPSYGRIMWQTWRQSRSMLVACFLICLVAFVFVSNGWFYDAPPLASAQWMIGLMICCGVVSLFAPSVFRKDHQRSLYQFFHQNREHPTAFWLARLTPWLVMIAGIVIMLYVSVLLVAAQEEMFGSGQYDSSTIGQLQWMGYLTGGVFWLPAFVLIAALGCGQFWSMFIRNPIINTVVTAVTSIALLSYINYLFFIRENMTLFVLPIVAALFLATWVRSKYWLAERNGLVLWSAPIAVVGLVAMIAFGSMAWHRATEYPDLSFDFSDISKIQPSRHTEFPIAAIGSAKQREATADLYRRALEHARKNTKGTGYFSYERSKTLTEKMVPFHRAQKPAIDLILEAARSPVCDPFLRSIAPSDNLELDEKEIEKLRDEVSEDVQILTSAIYVDYLSHMSNGELGLALISLLAHDRLVQRTNTNGLGNRDQLFYRRFCERLVDWADSPGQKVGLIKFAIFKLEGFAGAAGSDGSYKHAFEHNRMEEKLFRLYYGFKNSSRYVGMFSWDKIRTRRWDCHQQAQYFWQVWENAKLRNDQGCYDQGYFDLGGEYVRRGLFLTFARDPMALMFSRESWMKQAIEDETQLQRYTLLRLALVAYGIEKGAYPQRLFELEGYFTRGLPKTPKEGRNFGWFPAGVGKTVAVGNDLTLISNFPDTPILFPIPAEDIDELGLVDIPLGSDGKLPNHDSHLPGDWRLVSLMKMAALKEIEKESSDEIPKE